MGCKKSITDVEKAFGRDESKCFFDVSGVEKLIDG